jgi:RAP1 GTPase activating protein 1
VRNFDSHTVNKNFKFGVVYMRKGQVTEEELFSNQEHSEHFDKFLNLLGRRVKLKDFTGFRAGLDNVHGQTGEYSIYENYQNKEIMYHVSTLLPFNRNDSQQLERKRHIGNDIVAVVFQEDSTPFAPDMIASNFLHTFIVVQRVVDDAAAAASGPDETRYKVSVTARKDVPNFAPSIPSDGMFEHDQVFRDWLLNKLINAEYASYKADKFKMLKERTRISLLDSLFSDLTQKNQIILSSLTEIPLPSPSSHTNGGNYSMREFTSNNSSSMLALNPATTPTSNSTNNLNSHSSASFKFSLINTVRKAFKSKESKEAKENKESKKENSSNGKTSRAGSSTLPFHSHHGSVSSETSSMANGSTNLQMMSNEVATKSAGRLRSATFDAPNSSNNSSAAATPPSLHSIKQQQKMRKGSKESKSSKVSLLFLIK